jgi:two-component system NarL family sensor kinase
VSGASEAERLRARVAELEAEVERLRAELEGSRRFAAQAMDAEDRARRRIAQLIHDDILPGLLAANQELSEAASGGAGAPRAHEVVSGAIERLREAMLALHPVTLERGGLERALEAVARWAESRADLVVDLRVDPAAVGRNDELVLAAARELLANAARHSGARRARVRVGAEPDAVTLEVSDDGRGMERDRPRRALAEGHIGLASVEQRIEGAGGELEIDSAPGRGTSVRVRIPDGEPGEAR